MSVGRFPHTYFRKFQINFPFLDEENARYGWNGEHRLLPQPPPSSLLLPSSQLPPPVLQLRGRPDNFGCRVGLQSSSPSLLQKGLVNKALRLSVFCKAFVPLIVFFITESSEISTDCRNETPQGFVLREFGSRTCFGSVSDMRG
ncbi:uncharacterized protein LOC116253357 [Nymphaea colorata]|nr:uncharacterized protein LOC116253357 [Nymphaea colorata]